jgi:U6 snRNA-associated Sm-like protein LSm7
MAGRGAEKPKKESILDLSPYYGKKVFVKFNGGREVEGILRGYDTLVNIVLDDCVEFIRDPEDQYKITDKTRSLGLCVCRGSAVMCCYPSEGTQEIANPFNDAD